MTVIMREGSIGGRWWRKYVVVRNAEVRIVDMIERKIGWDFGKVEVQGDDDWMGMSEEGILSFKREYGRDDCATIVTDQNVIERVKEAAGL